MNEMTLARERSSQKTSMAFADMKHCDGRERTRRQNDIIVDHIELADTLARRYRRGNEDYSDLRQVALLGLVKAVRRYDPDRGTPFVPYAIPTITGELKRHLRDHGWFVRPGRQLQELCGAMTSTRPRLAQQLGREPSDEELAEELGATPTAVRDARACLAAQSPVAVDAPDDDDTPVVSLRAEDDSLERAELRALMARALAGLTPREALIVHRRFIEERTQAEIGRELGVSQMQVSRLLSQILTRLRGELLQTLPSGLADAA
jgi:RNA polymerase sigma-B factor